ncbi:hypothetical protein CEE37_10040 [candidate division LCP-89 bacterium B3_LCP]|uniref:Uncharacterized protein n=1 Tax=candidate division LCP-89 bacterium B3_LCP TaxID=2012998 RepID=A0A532UYS8_UNCL8|nr:MAG: hypothetical protein CEE37_10040 [candidate division LCP-89 bacterium B3_LCP]
MSNEPTGSEEPNSGEDLIKVKDRKGNTKVMTRTDFNRKKRSKKRGAKSKSFPYTEVISIAFILTMMIIAAYVAIKIVQ